MSVVASLDVRERWKAKSVVLRRWLTNGQNIEQGTPICELEIDGQLKTILAPPPFRGDLYGAFRAYVRVGEEVMPSGWLLERTSSFAGDAPDTLPIATVARARRELLSTSPAIFLSYRHLDTEAYAGRLHAALAERFAATNVFMDMFSIRPGAPFPWAIQQAATLCDLMVVLVGPKWLSKNKNGRRRIDDPRDFVLREVCTALDRSIPIVPVLAQRARVPGRDHLPADLEGLDELQFLELTARRWDDDVELLLNEIQWQLRAQLPALLERKRDQS